MILSCQVDVKTLPIHFWEKPTIFFLIKHKIGHSLYIDLIKKDNHRALLAQDLKDIKDLFSAGGRILSGFSSISDEIPSFSSIFRKISNSSILFTLYEKSIAGMMDLYKCNENYIWE
jgi:hypothetical protein